MTTRREFLIMSAGIGALLTINSPVFASSGLPKIKQAMAITQVYGDGIALAAIAVEYSASISASSLTAADFHVRDRTITDVFTSTSDNPADKSPAGNFVIITLSAKDKTAKLAEKIAPQGGSATASPPPGGPGKAGSIPVYDTIYAPAKASVTQVAAIKTAHGEKVPTTGEALTTTAVNNLIVDDFHPLEFKDPKTGRTLKYNLFIPKHYDASKRWPLVLFMHDAGATSDITRTTLFQGLGAISWASAADQAKRPCFVLAPQFEEIIADDDSHTSSMLDTTIDLIKTLSGQYSIDTERLYATGQSGGCMMSIAMNIKYPDFFAASFLVAGQWDPSLVKPLAHKKLWILVSQDDDKAWPGEQAIVEVLSKQGAKISRAIWDGEWSSTEFKTAFDKIDAENSPINFVAFRQGTVIPKGESSAGASGHRNTWRIAYSIEPIREWIFRHHN